MGSRGSASLNHPEPGRKPAKNSLPTPFIRAFRRELTAAMATVDTESEKRLSACIGIYCFFDYDGEPIYVGQTREKLSTRINRHLTGQRTDAVAYRMLDPFEVAEVAVWPINPDPDASPAQIRAMFDAGELAVYHLALSSSKFKAILNEKIPPSTSGERLPPKEYRFPLVAESMREDREHPDVRIARRSETLARLAAVANERGEVSAGMRRVIVIQAIRIAYLAALRLAYVEGRKPPDPSAVDMTALVGQLLRADEEDQADSDGVDLIAES